MTWIVDSRNGSLSITAGSHQNPFILVSEGPDPVPTPSLPTQSLNHADPASHLIPSRLDKAA